MKYYSQSNQDKWVDDFFNQKKNGFFIDIGAYDGVQVSNTFFLEKERQWNGICIEGNRDVYQTLKNNRTSTCLNEVIYSTNETLHFHNEGLCSKITETGSTTVTTTTLTQILKTYNAPKIIDYISLDIEGAEYDALLGFPWETHSFILLTVEHNLYKDGDFNKQRIQKLLLEKNFICVADNICGDPQHPFEDWYINSNYKK